MKMTKKGFYEQYGIAYENGKILAPWGAWISPLLTVGTNKKLGPGVASFSTLHGCEKYTLANVGPKTRAVMESAGISEIMGTCPCHCVGCYCDAGRYKFDGVRAALMTRTIVARFYPDFMRRAISAQLIADDIIQCRVHASGDFVPGEAATWASLKKSFPWVFQWTYTKRRECEKIDGVSVVPSLTPAGVNYGTCAEIIERRAALIAAGYSVHVCACGTPYEKHCGECRRGCKKIGRGVDFVLFIKHSTPGYKAGENDPEAFAALSAIIAGQEN